MAALLNEQQSYQDVNGKPIVNGFIYVGLQNADTKTNLISIFSDRELTVALANPQRTDGFGKSVTKIWVPGRHSLFIEDENNVQKLSDPDSGELDQTGIISLTNVQGINTITAEGIPAISSYIDKQQYILTLVSAPTGTTTLNIDSQGAVPIKNKNIDIIADQLFSGAVIVVAFNSIGPVFELISGVSPAVLSTPLDTNGFSIDFSEGAIVASASQPNIWGQDGNTLHISGTAQIDDFTNAPRIGATVTLIFDDVLTLLNGSGITLPGGENIITAAGDRFEVYADAVNAFSGVYIRNKPPVIARWVLIGTQVASNIISLLQTGLDSTFDTYAIVLSNFVPVTDNSSLLMRVGDSGGIDSGATDYDYHATEISSNSDLYNAQRSVGADSIQVANNVGNAATESCGGTLYLNRSVSNSNAPTFSGAMAVKNANTFITGGPLIASRRANINLDRIQVFFSAGNISEGRISIYGILHD